MDGGDAVAYLREKREKYVGYYRKVIRSHREKGQACTPEVWVRPNAEPGADAPQEPLCFDIVVDEPEPTLVSVMTGEIPEGPAVGSLDVGGVAARVFPIEWEACLLWVRVAKPDWAALGEWRAKWMDPERERPRDEDGLTGCVHFVGTPTAEGGGYLIEVDFGSASVEAMTELLDALVAMGATELAVGRSDGSDLPAAVVAELGRPDLTLRRLSEVVLGLFRELEEIERAELLSEGEVGVKPKQGGGHQVMLGNLYQLLQRTPPEGRAREVWRFVRGQREAMHEPEGAADLSQLRPLIKDDRFFADVRARAPKMPPIVSRRLAADLSVCCVWDAPNGMRFVTEPEVGPYGLTAEQVHERAAKNYLAERGEVEWAEHGRLLVARTHDCYDASLLLDDGFWEEVGEKVAGEVVACVPARDVVLVGGLGKEGTVAEMRAAARKVSEGRDHLISETILVRRGGRWEAYWVEGTGEADDGKRGKRPWWRLWG